MQYRSDIDGLRAVAVLPVILFHAGFGAFSGGFAGVDIFFVISGYLITGILLNDLEHNRFSLLNFYERRARRILPALFFVIIVCIPFAYLWLLPSQMVEFAQSILATIFFVSNIFFWNAGGYFNEAAEVRPLLHTWSLAVEEQFYLIFPILLWFLWRYARSRIFWCLVGISLVSFLLAEWGWQNKPGPNFYLAPTRAWELLAGSICALLLFGRVIGRASNILSAIGFGLILFSIFHYDESTPFPSRYTLAPVAGTALIILYSGPGTWVWRLLSLRPLVGIGLISYSAYLWHQPLFAFARLRSLTEPGEVTMAGLAILSLMLAWLTWRFVERPFRARGAGMFATRARVFVGSGAMACVLVVCGAYIVSSNGFTLRGDRALNLGDLDARVSINFGLTSECDEDRQPNNGCEREVLATTVLWGDSFAMHLAQGIEASAPDKALRQYALSSCSPILGLAPVGGERTKAWSLGCMEFNDSVFSILQKNDNIDLVVLSSSFEYVLNGKLTTRSGEIVDADIELVARQMLETVRQIQSTGARVVIVSPTPQSGWNIGHCVTRIALFKASDDRCNFEPRRDTKPLKLLRAIGDEVPVYWLDDDICEHGICYPYQDGVYLYRDRNHLSREGSAYLGRRFGWRDRFAEMAR